MKRHAPAAFTLAGLALLPACGALLDLPDPNVDPNYGQNTGDSGLLADGAYADGFVPPSDGSVTGKDGSIGNDGSLPPFDGGPACGSTPSCFGGECSANVCQPVELYTSSLLDPLNIASDGTNVYFFNGVDVIDKLDPDTRVISTFASSESNLTDLKVIGTNVYFTNDGFGTGGKGTVTRCPTSSDCATSRTDYVKNSSLPFWGITADATNVYFTEDTGAGGVYSCPVGASGCTPTQIGGGPSANAHALLESVGILYWDDDSSNQNGVFQCNAASCTKGGGSDDTFIVDIAANTANVLWANQTIVHKRVKSGGAKSEIVIQRVDIRAIAADETDVYWLDFRDGMHGTLERCAIATGCTNPSDVVTLATNISGASHLVVTADSVFFTSTGIPNPGVWRVAK